MKPKVTSVVSSAIQSGSLARSGTSATSTAPASGTRRINVRIDWSIDVISSVPRHSKVNVDASVEDVRPKNEEEQAAAAPAASHAA